MHLDVTSIQRRGEKLGICQSGPALWCDDESGVILSNCEAATQSIVEVGLPNCLEPVCWTMLDVDSLRMISWGNITRSPGYFSGKASLFVVNAGLTYNIWPEIISEVNFFFNNRSGKVFESWLQPGYAGAVCRISLK